MLLSTLAYRTACKLHCVHQEIQMEELSDALEAVLATALDDDSAYVWDVAGVRACTSSCFR